MDNDIIDISTNFDNISFSSSNNNKPSFGGGIELLMNDSKKKTSTPTSDIDIEDLTNLENELNDLANESTSSQFFGINTNFDEKIPSVRFDEPSFTSSPRENSFGSGGIGASTANLGSDNKTWDGYAKFNNIPVNPESKPGPETPKMTKEELLREKFRYLRKLEALEKKGIELTKKYNMDSNLAEMQGEYEMIMEEKMKQNSVKLQANIMMSIINGIEFLNNRFDPFDLKLDGWGEQINENVSDYDDIFAELYEKYKSRASFAPELKLLFQLGGSAMMVHMSNTMFKSAMPNMDDIFRQNPDLMHHFQTAAVNSMATSNPGFSGFMSGIMSGGGKEPMVPPGRGPPPPLSTQGPNGVPPPMNRAGNNNDRMNVGRGDISMARGVFVDDGININEVNNGLGFENKPQPAQKSSRRPDMKGPSDINDILSGLKTKTINVASQQPTQAPPSPRITVEDVNTSSMISLDDLKSLQGDANVPKRSRRRPTKSDKNTVSLDI